MIGDVILWLVVVLVLGIGVFFLDGCDLGVANGLDLVSVRQVRMVGGAHVIVVLIGLGGLHVFVRGDGEVMGGLAVVFGGVVVKFMFALRYHGDSPCGSTRGLWRRHLIRMPRGLR